MRSTTTPLERLFHEELTVTTIDYTNTMKDKTEYLTIKEIDSLLNHCYNQGKARDYMLILTLSRTGRRITEIVGEKPYTRKVGMRPIDIHPDGLIEFDILKKNHIRLRSTKTGIKRDLETVEAERLRKMPKRVLKPIDDYFLDELETYIISEAIGLYQRIFPITSRRANQIIRKVARACKIHRLAKGISSKNFRHSFVINLLKDNPDNAAVLRHAQELADHSNINVTMHYAQFTQSDKKEVLNKLFNK